MTIISFHKSFFIVVNKFSMNAIPLFFTIISMLVGYHHSTSQTTQLYIDYEGQIIDRETYLKTKDEATQAYQKQNAKDTLYEEAFDIKTNHDTTLSMFNWIITQEMDLLVKNSQKEKENIGKLYPLHRIEKLDGSIIDIDSLKGKPTLINLWFTRCPPCIKEMPILNKLKENYQDRFNFLAITMDKKKTVETFLKKHAFHFDHIAQSNELTLKLGFYSYPTNIILDKNGHMKVYTGAVRHERRLLKILEGLE